MTSMIGPLNGQALDTGIESHQYRGLLAGWWDAGSVITRSDGQAVGHRHGSSAADARGAYLPNSKALKHCEKPTNGIEWGRNKNARSSGTWSWRTRSKSGLLPAGKDVHTTAARRQSGNILYTYVIAETDSEWWKTTLKARTLIRSRLGHKSASNESTVRDGSVIPADSVAPAEVFSSTAIFKSSKKRACRCWVLRSTYWFVCYYRGQNSCNHDLYVAGLEVVILVYVPIRARHQDLHDFLVVYIRWRLELTLT